MESFEHVTKIWLESQGFVVSSGVKFPVRIRTRKKAREEDQTHGYEVDLVGARADRLVLVNVKSFFGSIGLSLPFLQKEKMFSNPEILQGILDGAAARFGYSRKQMEIFVVAGRVTAARRRLIEPWLVAFSKERRIPVRFFTAADVSKGLLEAAQSKMYIDDPVITTVKTLRASGWIKDLA